MESIGLSYLLIRIPTVAKRILNPSSPGLDSKKQRYISVSLLFQERETGVEPATFSLARRRYTTKPLAQIVLMFSTTSDNILYDSHFVNNNLGNIYENKNNPQIN